MRDRLPELGKEGRVRLTLDSGEVIEGVLSFADNAVQSGSIYNKANVLPDDVCDALGIDRQESEPKDAFFAVRKYAQKRESTFQKLMTGGMI